MKLSAVVPVLAASMLGCASGSGGAPEAATLDTALMPAMKAIIRPMGGGIQGEATVLPGNRPGQFRATVSIMGSQAGQQHPWHVHAGRCDAPDQVVGGMLEYRMLDVRGDGKAESVATVNADLQLGRSYFVDIHLSRGDMDRVIACGNFSAS